MSGRPRPDFDPFATLVHLRQHGDALPVAWTPDVRRRLATGDGDRVIGAKRGVVPADFHADEWEIHPGGDELLYLLTGAVDVTPAHGTRHRPVGPQAAGRPKAVQG